MVGLALQIEFFQTEPFHELHEWLSGGGLRQFPQFFRTDDNDALLATHCHVLWAIAMGATHNLGEPRLGVFELPSVSDMLLWH
jgi:hypothetical protein